MENKSSPNFSAAIGITSFIILFSILFSIFTTKIYSIFPDTILITVWSFFASFVLSILLLWHIFKRYKTYVFQSLQQPRYYFAKGFIYYLLFLPILFIVATFSFYIFKKVGFTPEPQQVMHLYLQADSFFLLSIMVFLSCVVAPFAEEIIFRSVIYTGFKKRFSINISIILSSLIFALLHNELFVLPALFAFACYLSHLFEKYENLWVPISVHFYNNFFSTVIVLILKYFYNI